MTDNAENQKIATINFSARRPQLLRRPQLSPRRLRNLGAGLIALLVLFAAAGSIHERWVSTREQRLHPPPGRLVDIGGYRLHLYCMGEGSHTVILEAGFKRSSAVWYAVQPQVAKFARVCAYDRAGYGWSDPGPRPRTAKVMAEELHSLLHTAGVGGPYVLVGHSYGGLTVRAYASQYPDEVAGVVLVDSSHPDERQWKHLAPVPKGYHPLALRLKLAALSAPFGLPRLMGWCGSGPPETQSITRAIECRSQFFDTARAETIFHVESEDQVRGMGPFRNIPLIVLSRDLNRARRDSTPGQQGPWAQRAWKKVRTNWSRLLKTVTPEFEPPETAINDLAWQEMQEDLARLSTSGKLVVATGSGHYIQFDRPDAVVDAIRSVAAFR